MNLQEFKEMSKLTPEEEIEYTIQKARNLKFMNLYNSIRKHSAFISIILLLSFNLVSLYLLLPFIFATLITALFFNKKYNYYKQVVYVNNMTDEDHFKFLENI